MTEDNIEEQTRNCIELIRTTLKEARCSLNDVVKSMVWLKNRDDFPGFNSVYGEYLNEGSPVRSALVCDFLIDIKVEIDCTAYKPEN